MDEDKMVHRFPAASLARMLREYRDVVETFGNALSPEKQDDIVRDARKRSYHADFKSLEGVIDGMIEGAATVIGTGEAGSIILYNRNIISVYGHFAWGFAGYLHTAPVDGASLVREGEAVPWALCHYENMLARGYSDYLIRVMPPSQVAVFMQALRHMPPFGKSLPCFAPDGKLLRKDPTATAFALATGAYKAKTLCKSDKAGFEFIRHVHDGLSFLDAYQQVEQKYRQGP